MLVSPDTGGFQEMLSNQPAFLKIAVHMHPSAAQIRA